jgi:hypothetical protein
MRQSKLFIGRKALDKLSRELLALDRETMQAGNRVVVH